MTMPRTLTQPTATHAWYQLLRQLLLDGQPIGPRGMATREVLNATIAFPMRYPVICCPARKLSYKFMAAEALWVTAGNDKAADIVPYNKHMAEFSDDGETFAGAYGPPWVDQLDYLLRTLGNDQQTRQAVVTLWRPNPKPSKDIPCTVALTFNIRDNKLNCHVFMRSSDIWLGVPYDFFTFTMMATKLRCIYNDTNRQRVQPGLLYFTAVSSHLYDRDLEQVKLVNDELRLTVNGPLARSYDYPMREPTLMLETPKPKPWEFYRRSLLACRDLKPTRQLEIEGLWRIRYDAVDG